MLVNTSGVSKEIFDKLGVLKEQDIADTVIAALQTPQSVEVSAKIDAAYQHRGNFT